MAKDLTPDAWIPGIAHSAGNITIPLASLDGALAGDYDATTGDIRKVLIAVLRTVADHYDGLPSADRPETMKPSFVETADTISGTLRFLSEPTAIQLQTEPA